MIHTLTVEARHLPGLVRDPGTVVYLRAVEGASLTNSSPNLYPATGLLVEDAAEQFDDDLDEPGVGLSVWHGADWMFGILLSPGDVVAVDVEARVRPELPAPPDRTGMVRVHGTWKERTDA